VSEESQTGRNQDLGSDHLNYAAVRFQTKPKRHHRPASDREMEPNVDLGSDHLNYAALSFQTKPKRHRRPASDREMEPNVVYAATR
ncbi:hypothetical protein INR49_027966, partial [Caranx melampygus]